MDGQLIQKKDCSAAVAAVKPEAQSLAQAGKLAEAVELLMGVEKQARMGNDVPSLKEVCLFTVRLVREHNDWEQLNATLTLISKRRQQNKAAITAVVQEGMTYLDQAPGKEAKRALITTLRDITDGKIFVEAERARLTRQLSALLESEGKVGEACDIIQDVHVETYGSLGKEEKVDFILEQIRLTLAKKDFIRTFIIAKKVTKKLLEGEEMQALKVRFYRLMIEYHALSSDKDAFEVAQHYHAIYDTPSVQADEAQWGPALQACVLFLIISPHSNQQHDMLHRLAADERLASLPTYTALLKAYTTHEIIQYPLPQLPEIEAHAAITQHGPELAAHWLGDLRTRVIQHNVRVLARYYRRLRLSRAAELLSLSVAEVEANVAVLVSDGALYARVDRPANQVCFAKPKVAEETLSDWAADIAELLTLVERTTHLINKEQMVHKVGTAAATTTTASA